MENEKRYELINNRTKADCSECCFYTKECDIVVLDINGNECVPIVECAIELIWKEVQK